MLAGFVDVRRELPIGEIHARSIMQQVSHCIQIARHEVVKFENAGGERHVMLPA